MLPLFGGRVGGGIPISNLPVGKGFKTYLGRKRRIKRAFRVSKNSNNNKKPPSPSRAAPAWAAAFLTEIHLARARNLKRKHDLRRKWCMLTKHDLSHMGKNKRNTRLITTQPPSFTLRPRGWKRKRPESGQGGEGNGGRGPGRCCCPTGFW